jgi:uncharacterized membrane protein
MSYKRYMLFRLLGVLVLAFLAAWATTTGHLLVMIPVIIVIGTVLFSLKKRVKEVVVDERVYSVADKASRLAFIIFVILAVIVGAILISLSRTGSPELFPIGLSLAYSVCGLLCIYWIAYIYYNRKFGGRE